MLSIEERLRRYEPFFGEWVLGERPELLGTGQSSYVYTIHSGPRTAALKVVSIPMDESALRRLRSGGSWEQVQAVLQRDYQYARREIKTMDKLIGTNNIVYFENCAIYERNDIGNGIKGWDVLIRMEKLIPLERYLKKIGSRRTTRLVLRIWDELLEGLKACQSHKIVHLDIKPQNIFYAEGRDYFKLGDFSEAQQGDLVAVNCKFGTRGYIPPEIEAKRGGDGRADLYSLALVIYSLLNHDCLPFMQPGAERTNEALERVDMLRCSGCAIPRIKGVNPEVMDILLRCLECDPNRRFRTAAEVQAALRRARQNEKPTVSLKAMLTAAAALGVVSIMIILGTSVFGGAKPPEASTKTAVGQVVQEVQISVEPKFRIVNGAVGPEQKYEFEGSAKPKTKIQVLLNGEVIRKVKSDKNGRWSVTIKEDLLIKKRTCTVGFAYERSLPVKYEFVYDAEVSPFSIKNVYQNSREIRGNVEPGAKVTLITQRGNVEIGSGTADENGSLRMQLNDGKVLSELGVFEGDKLILWAEDMLGNQRKLTITVQDASSDARVEFSLDSNVGYVGGWLSGTAPTNEVLVFKENTQLGGPIPVENGQFEFRLDSYEPGDVYTVRCVQNGVADLLAFSVRAAADEERQRISMNVNLASGVLTGQEKSFKLYGTAEPGMKITLYLGNRDIFNGKSWIQVDEQGNWSYELAVDDTIRNYLKENGKMVFSPFYADHTNYNPGATVTITSLD